MEQLPARFVMMHRIAPFEVCSRNGKLWHPVDKVELDYEGNVMFKHRNTVNRRTLPDVTVLIRPTNTTE